jgi:hypothetical protein
MNIYCCLADAIAVVHFIFVVFVIGGMAAILAGIVLHWTWIRNFWFRAIHLAMIAAVVAESLCGIACPLTDWEDRLREAGGAPSEPGTFIGRLIDSVLFVDVSPSVLGVCYVVFGLLVLLAFVLAPPRWPRRSRKL